MVRLYALIKTEILTPSNTNINGINVISNLQEVTTNQNNEWNVTILSENTWQFIIALDNTWGFHTNLLSTIKLKIYSSSIGGTETFDDILFGFTVTNNEYISTWIPMDNNGQKNRIYPNCDKISNPTQSFGIGNIETLPNVNRDCDIAGGECSNWKTLQPKNAQYPNQIEYVGFPLTFTLENDPIVNKSIISFQSALYTSTFIQKCGFISFPTNQGLKIYIAGNNPGHSFAIKSFQIQYNDSTHSNITHSPTFEPTIEPTIEPTLEPTTTETPNIIQTTGDTPSPTNRPLIIPTIEPTINPTLYPTLYPTIIPSVNPNPTKVITATPTTYSSTIDSTVNHSNYTTTLSTITTSKLTSFFTTFAPYVTVSVQYASNTIFEKKDMKSDENKYSDIKIPIICALVVGSCALCSIFIIIIRKRHLIHTIHHKYDKALPMPMKPIRTQSDINAIVFRGHKHKYTNSSIDMYEYKEEKLDVMDMDMKMETNEINTTDRILNMLDEINDHYNGEGSNINNNTIQASDDLSSDTEESVVVKPELHNYSTNTLQMHYTTLSMEDEKLHRPPTQDEMSLKQIPLVEINTTDTTNSHKRQGYHCITNSEFDQLQTAINHAKTVSDFQTLENMIKQQQIPTANWNGKQFVIDSNDNV